MASYIREILGMLYSLVKETFSSTENLEPSKFDQITERILIPGTEWYDKSRGIFKVTKKIQIQGPGDLILGPGLYTFPSKGAPKTIKTRNNLGIIITIPTPPQTWSEHKYIRTPEVKEDWNSLTPEQKEMWSAANGRDLNKTNKAFNQPIVIGETKWY